MSTTKEQRTDEAIEKHISFAQFHEEISEYNRAIQNVNKWLDVHESRRDYDVSHYDELEAPETEECLEDVRRTLLDQRSKDSDIRIDPGIYPIHVEAVEQLEYVGGPLLRRVEEELRAIAGGEPY